MMMMPPPPPPPPGSKSTKSTKKPKKGKKGKKKAGCGSFTDLQAAISKQNKISLKGGTYTVTKNADVVVYGCYTREEDERHLSVIVNSASSVSLQVSLRRAIEMSRCARKNSAVLPERERINKIKSRLISLMRSVRWPHSSSYN